MKKLLLSFLFVVPILANAQTTSEAGELGPAPGNHLSSAFKSPVAPPDFLAITSKAYGSNSNVGTLAPGPFSVYMDDLKGAINLGTALPTGQFLFSGAWLNNQWYGFMYSASTATPPNVRNLVTVDTLTGAITLVGATGLASASIWEGIGMDLTTHTAYALASKGASPTSSSLYTINLATGVTTLIGTSQTGITLINMAISRTGTIYAVDITADNLGTIDKTTGMFTVIGPIGFNASYAQSMHFDYETDILYFACLNILTASPLTYVTELRTVDLSTGMTTSLGIFPDMSEVTAFAIPYDMNISVGDIANNGSVALSVTPNVVTDHSKISFSLPKEGMVRLEILDVCGKKVSSLVSESMSKGNHEVNLSTAGLNAGIYFCSLQTASGNQSAKVIISK